MFLNLPDWMRYEFQHRWERLRDCLRGLAIRKWINDNPRIIFCVACISALILLGVTIKMLIPAGTVKIEDYDRRWFYDLNTGQLFAAKKSLIPPIEAPSGPLPNGNPAGILACVFSYTYEPNEAELIIGFLEMPDPNFNADCLNSRLSGGKRWGQGKLIRKVEDKQWVPANSKEGQAILEEFLRPNENGRVANFCVPN